MVRSFLIPLLLLTPAWVIAQRALHFTKTSGFDHGTRTVSYTMFEAIGNEIGLQVDSDDDGSSFSDPNALLEYDVIIFSNTSGNAILDDQQRANFEMWAAQGGRVLGIHAASDTYRHSTANGNNTGSWDFYAELIGGSVQENPNHVSGTPSYAMNHLTSHSSTANLPDPWLKEEEYYYWENGYLHPGNTAVLEVEETLGPNGQVNSYDAPRPMSWFRLTENGRIFYTALGHAASNFTSDPLFRTHLKDALVWLLEGITTIGDHSQEDPPISIEMGQHAMIVRSTRSNGHITLRSIEGKLISTKQFQGPSKIIDLRTMVAGCYIISIETDGATYSQKIMIQ